MSDTSVSVASVVLEAGGSASAYSFAALRGSQPERGYNLANAVFLILAVGVALR